MQKLLSHLDCGLIAQWYHIWLIILWLRVRILQLAKQEINLWLTLDVHGSTDSSLSVSIPCTIFLSSLLCPSTIVVRHSTRNTKIKGSNRASGNTSMIYTRCPSLLVSIPCKSFFSSRLCPSTIVVEHTNHNPKMKGLNPTNGLWRDKISRKNFLFYRCGSTVGLSTVEPPP